MHWKQLVGIAALAAAPALAQPEQSAVDVYGGYSFLRQDLYGHRRQSAHGWNADVTAHLWKRLSVTAQFGGNYGAEKHVEGASRYTTTYLFGPHVRLLDWKRLRVSGRLLAGVARQESTYLFFWWDQEFPRLSTWTGNDFAAALGGTVDIKLARWISWRAVQVDVLKVGVSGVARWEFRYSTGAVIHFGSK